MRAYLDSSVILRLVLGDAVALKGWREMEARICSELVETECLRALYRLGRDRRMEETEMSVRREALFGVLSSTETVDLTRPILKRAGDPFPATVATLDAIHLSTALYWQEYHGLELAMATHDGTMARVARALRMEVIGI